MDKKLSFCVYSDFDIIIKLEGQNLNVDFLNEHWYIFQLPQGKDIKRHVCTGCKKLPIKFKSYIQKSNQVLALNNFSKMLEI